VDAFVSGAGAFNFPQLVLCYLIVCHDTGTGGTISGTGQFMKMMNDNVMVVLADPEGSGLYNKVGFTFSLFTGVSAAQYSSIM
jgi:cysteine synthase